MNELYKFVKDYISEKEEMYLSDLNNIHELIISLNEEDYDDIII